MTAIVTATGMNSGDLEWTVLAARASGLSFVQNVAPRVVTEILGHSEISLTMNTYSHVLPGLKREAAEQVDRLLTGGWERD